jgi:hypothetical protein
MQAAPQGNDRMRKSIKIVSLNWRKKIKVKPENSFDTEKYFFQLIPQKTCTRV